MNNLLAIVFIFLVFSSCQKAGMEKGDPPEKIEFQVVKKDEYELISPKVDPKEVLVLFGGYPEKVEDIKREFKIVEITKQKGLSLILMNYNQKLWLEENEKQKLADELQSIFEENNLPKSKVYLGGFSSGGNVALLMSDFLIQQNFEMTPKAVFAVDSPVDLQALYKSAEKNVARAYSDVSVQEGTWLLEKLEKQFGKPDSNLSNYENYSIYTSKTDNFENIKSLKNVKIRFYAEPDALWWKENRKADYDQMNAYYLKRLSESLEKSGFDQVEYITTENKGYRANGDRHPHSWSIVDKEELIKWIKE